MTDIYHNPAKPGSTLLGRILYLRDAELGSIFRAPGDLPAAGIGYPSISQTHCSMNCSRKTRILARLLIVIPMLWVVSPWHGIHHQSDAFVASDTDGHGVITATAKTNDLSIDESDTTHNPSIFVAGASHCDSGPCVASVDTGNESVHLSVTSRYVSLGQPETVALVTPLIRPPTLSSTPS